MEFQVGDTVRRMYGERLGMRAGDTATVTAIVTAITAGDSLVLAEYPGYHVAAKFQLVKRGGAKAREESDPTGKDPHQPGAKLDAGKVRPSLIIEGMARAVWAVSEVATFGAAKYTPGGWVLVDNGQERYTDAGYRHVLKRAIGELNDPDSKKLHLAHEAWNALAKLDLYLREQEKVHTK